MKNTNPFTMKKFYTQQGVTLIELMVSVSIAIALAASVAPSIQATISQNAIAAQMNQMSALAQFARGYAINNQSETTFCASADYLACSNDWNQAKIVLVDINGDLQRNDNEPLLASIGIEKSSHDVQGPQVSIRFLANGGANNNADILFCSYETSSNRALMISLQGRVKTSQDSDNNDVHEDRNGDALNCS